MFMHTTLEVLPISSIHSCTLARSYYTSVHHHGNTVNSGTSCVIKRMYGKRDPFVQTVRWYNIISTNLIIHSIYGYYI